MSADPLKPVRDHLVAACNLLAGNSERTEALSDRLRAVERQMDWRGDPHKALSVLPAIITELGELKTTRPGVESGTDELTQDPEKILLPDVGEAIAQLEQAVILLRAQP